MQPLFFETECFRIKVEQFVNEAGIVEIERVFIGVKELSSPTDESGLIPIVDKMLRTGERVHVISAEKHV